ncbi:MAG TPA: two-component regulator propeller domain-containing protein, partial [Chitinophagaceae bacterium]
MIKHLLIILFVFAGYNSVSQTIIPRFESLGVNEGLPHSSVYSIIQDKKGFMWFGTADGLCRYDGGELKTFKYTARYEGDEVNNFVRGKILEDKTGNIWYCNESGIYKWDVLKEVVTREKSFDKKKFGNADFQAIHLDAKNGMWIFNYLQGMYEFNILTGAFTQYSLPLINNSAAILTYVTVDNAGNFWIKTGTATDPFIFFNLKSRSYSFQFVKDPPQAIFFGKKNPVLAYEDRLVYT